ncbi:MAG: NAD-dependent epimerase/dehydratase family protein [Gammaproteobacteria bacterium]|jgi:UDP-glucose 4-epimerase
MKALVLGGNGFIGSHIVDYLLAAGHQVRVLDRSAEHFREAMAEVDYHLGDYGEAGTLKAALEGIDIVYHLASTTVPATSNQDPVADIQVNLVKTVQLLQSMVRQNVPRILFMSSGGTVYGIPEQSPIPESHPLKPICSYGVVKVAIENYLFMYRQLDHISPVVLRASNPYGERQGHTGVQGVIGTFLNKLRSGEPIEIWGDGSIVRDFLHVSDLADFAVRAGTSEFQGVLNAGSGEGYSICNILDAVANVTGQPVEPVFKQGRDYDVPEVVLDVTRAREEFGWDAKIDLSDGIERTWNWMQPC